MVFLTFRFRKKHIIRVVRQGKMFSVPEGVRGGNAVIVKHFKTAVTASKIHL